MKKGLRPLYSDMCISWLAETQTDLMKKGLRPCAAAGSSSQCGNTDRPDEEGIKTDGLPQVVHRLEKHRQT